MTLAQPSPRNRRLVAIFIAALALPASAIANDGRLLATGGATQFEGSAGGGLVPWAVLSAVQCSMAPTVQLHQLCCQKLQLPRPRLAVQALGQRLQFDDAVLLRLHVEVVKPRQVLHAGGWVWATGR